MTGGCRRIAFALAVLTAATQAAALELPTIPAHWTDATDAFEPQRGDFTFDALSFVGPDEGWIVGDRYLLHVTARGLELQFTRGADLYVRAVDASSDGTVLLGGMRLHGENGGSRGVILRRAGDTWRDERIAADELWNWSVHEVRAAGPAGWALGIEERGPGHQPVLWQRADDWRVSRPSGRRAGDFWMLSRLCVDASGVSWFVGREYSEQYQPHALAVRHRDGAFERLPIPPLSEPNTLINRVACLGDGTAVAIGAAGTSDSGWGSAALGMLLHHDSDWHGEWFPSHLRGYGVDALAALSADDVWLALSSPQGDRTLFLHKQGADWIEVPPPALPDGRVGGYAVTDMQFVSANEGWAVANDSGGPGLVRGLIFHYRDGIWRHRNWNWHFWHQPFFGLLGD